MDPKFDSDFIEEDCVDCNENATKLMQEIEEGLALIDEMQPGVQGSVSRDDIIANNVIMVYDGDGNLVSSLPEPVLEQTLKTYKDCGVDTRKWVFTRSFRQADHFVANIDEQRERLNEQNRNLNPEPTPEQPGVLEESDTLPEEGLFRVDLNEDLLRQHSDLCDELRSDSNQGDSES